MKLGDICDINMGQSPSSETYNTNNSGIPFFQGNADFGERSPIVRIYCSKPTKIAKKGDILFSVRAPIGAINIADCECCIGRGLSALTPKKSTTEYLFFLLKAKNKILQSLGTGSTFKAINKNTLLSLPISSHSINEQRIISNKLSLIENAIRIRERQLVKLNQLAKSRFLEMFGDPILNPMGWAISHYGDEFEIMSGGTPKTDIPEYWVNGKISWIGSNLCQNSVLIENDGKFITEKGLNNSSAKIFNKGYILIALVGATIGKVAHLKFSTSTNQNIAGINVPQNENYIPEFVFYNTQFLYPKFMDIGNSKFKMANLSFIRSLQIPIVPIKAQKKFSNFVEQLDKSKFRAKKCLKLFGYMRHLWKIEI